jgi:hypothetical protein
MSVPESASLDRGFAFNKSRDNRGSPSMLWAVVE